MYKSFRVKNFRCFKDLQISDLGRVNLIAGKNNTGKTALLEAMYLYTRPKSPKVLIDLQDVRGILEPEGNRRDYWKQFFYDMDSSETMRFETSEIGSDMHSALLITELAVDRRSARAFHGYGRFLEHAHNMSSDESLKYIERIDAILEFSVDAAGHQWSPAYLPSDAELPTNSFHQAELKSEFVPVQGRAKKSTTLTRFSQLDQEGDTTLLVDAMTTLDDRISDLRLSMPDGVMDIWARVNGTLLPLKAMGEGVNRTCHILVTMLSDMDYLFIDEIENGIHYSAQKDVWKAIGKVAREQNIQVFATTHSYEMIRAAHEAFKDDDKDDFRFHRLYHDSQTGKIEARTYNEFSVEAAVSRNREVRG